MKVLVIGDLLGSDEWKNCGDISKLLKEKTIPEYDFYVFLGNYIVRNEEITPEVASFFREVINFKLEYPNKVVLLIGEHDLNFLLDKKELKKFSLFVSKWTIQKVGRRLFKEYEHLFQPVFQLGNNIFSNSLIHKNWYKLNLLPELRKEKPYKNLYINIADRINIAWKHRVKALFYRIMEYNMYTGKRKIPSLFYQNSHEITDCIEDTKNYIGRISLDREHVYIKNDYTKIHLINTDNEDVSCKIINIKN